MKPKTQRQIRVENLVRQEVSSAIIRDLAGFLPCPISIVSVDTSKDLRYATVSYSCMDSESVDDVQQILNKAAHSLNKTLGKAIHTKYTPKLRFIYDKSIEYSDEINQIMQKIHYSDQNDDE
ncbi:MAG: 30S ribosome-binding factor RbfA [Proteobacteria bacterium]|nr:30S ribosome-binding factor RbfA [Pseudomonadota bacterium]